MPASCTLGTHLILFQFAVLIFLLALRLERENDEANKNVDHEEGDDDEVGDVVDGHDLLIVVDWSLILNVRVDGIVQHSVNIREVRSYVLYAHENDEAREL
jgi:hypothetical protein